MYKYFSIGYGIKSGSMNIEGERKKIVHLSKFELIEHKKRRF